eukprot:2124457-Rhodomonas_salina.1
MHGTELAYAAMRPVVLSYAMMLRLCYALAGTAIRGHAICSTELAYAAMPHLVLNSRTGIAYPATRCAVLS